MNAIRKRILMLDDETQLITPFGAALGREGHDVKMVSCMAEAEELLRTGSFDLLILDALIPVDEQYDQAIVKLIGTDDFLETGFEFYRFMRDRLKQKKTEVLVFTIATNLKERFLEAGLPANRFAGKSELSHVREFVVRVDEILRESGG